ncbi:MAG: Tol-Pal system protein TolB [Geminicoccaceae bacterium]|nr:Tol-Pal system protein TolB [Geminicoccaceae bacterium]
MRQLTRRAFQQAGLAMFTVGGLGAGQAEAQLKVDITSGRVEPMPVALSPLAGVTADDASLGVAMIDVVGADLQGSGLFRVIDRRAYIQSPQELQGIPRFADWRQINAQALVSGTVGRQGANGIFVEFRLWDIFAGSQMRGLRFDGDAGEWRRIAHKIADVVYERLTGDSGYFDTRIVYISETGPATRRVKRLAIMDQDGAGHTFLTDGGQLVLTPHISPDGRRVAYLVYQSPMPKVFMRDLATGRQNALGSFRGMSFSPRFSPDGSRLLMTLAADGNSDIFAFSASGGDPRRLTSSPAIDTSPSYSPDGRSISFNSDRGGSPQLYVMDADGGNVRRISYGAGNYGSPAWSPRGDLIAFTKIKGGMFHIGVMEPDGGNERLLTRSFLDQGPTWSPNGRVIMFSREDPIRDRTRLFTIDITGYNEREVPTPLDASDPDWSPLIS